MAQHGDDIPQGRIRRTAPVAGAVARTAGEAVVVALRRKATGAEVKVDAERAAERYAQLLGRSRGALMKAGQQLSFVTMGPAAPPEVQSAFRNALGRLREDAPPMEPELAVATLAAELRRPLDEVFAVFDERPVASASIGQVHRAVLHDGREVAVKIQYPGVANAIETDLANFQLLATFIQLLMGLSPRRLGVDNRQIAREISGHIRDELDYRKEAASQRAFAEAYRDHPFIRVPAVIDELSTSRVLTQEFIHGLDWKRAQRADEPLRRNWAEVISRFCHDGMTRQGLAHVDPHPGNFRLHEDGGVTFLDFGCVAHVNARALPIIEHALRGDVQNTWRSCLGAGQWKASDPVTAEQAFAYWRGTLEPYWGPQPFRITHEKVARWIELRFSPTGPSAAALRYMSAPDDITILARLDFGVMSLLADLDVAVPWGAIANEFYLREPPQTELGKVHRDWLAGKPETVLHA